MFLKVMLGRVAHRYLRNASPARICSLSSLAPIAHGLRATAMCNQYCCGDKTGNLEKLLTRSRMQSSPEIGTIKHTPGSGVMFPNVTLQRQDTDDGLHSREASAARGMQLGDCITVPAQGPLDE
ncbi:hypothetical protein FA95DRAFT_1592320 [Auriscalpium vulgare]|uniref:Uncharacterized protein n=1 Tax=Auriscalpium vulgare TaxID=40419 RepID=A0ACB8SAL7_9AGAM|nr:hypothetical protein FA95DRAFT_1592320 [Auriscalpium vulgare]